MNSHDLGPLAYGENGKRTGTERVKTVVWLAVLMLMGAPQLLKCHLHSWQPDPCRREKAVYGEHRFPDGNSHT
jgi:hypothetical protein